MFQNKEKKREFRICQLKSLSSDELSHLLSFNKDEKIKLISTMGKTHSYVYCLWCRARINEIEWENREIIKLLADKD